MNVLQTIATAIFCFIAAAETASGAVVVTPLPAPEFADTEVSTNVCLVVTQELSAGDNRRFFDVSLSLVATAAMFSPQWNIARVVARGGVESNERISVKMSRNAMRVIFK